MMCRLKSPCANICLDHRLFLFLPLRTDVSDAPGSAATSSIASENTLNVSLMTRIVPSAHVLSVRLLNSVRILLNLSLAVVTELANSFVTSSSGKKLGSTWFQGTLVQLQLLIIIFHPKAYLCLRGLQHRRTEHLLQTAPILFFCQMINPSRNRSLMTLE